VFWSLDRFTREGAVPTLQHLERLGSYGVRFPGYAEPYLDSCGVWGDAIIAILGTIAKQERIRISERVRAGLERARKNGTKTRQPTGRPRRVFDRDKVIDLRAQGLSWPQISQKVGASARTVQRTLQNGSK
jgi:DNA invertase Pin-like site-specific DNA recombinase